MSTRSRVGLGLTAAAALGRFELQVCKDCQTVQYPPREACHNCLSVRLEWKPQEGEGELLSETTLFHSNEAFFRERLPWRIALIRLDAGPTVLAHLHAAVAKTDTRVRVDARLDREGQAALIAWPQDEVKNMVDDQRMREMTSDLRGRNVFITDASTPTGQAIALATLEAGAARVWIGSGVEIDAPATPPQALDELRRSDRVSLLPFDITSDDSVKAAAARIGATVDVVINTAEYRSTVTGDTSEHRPTVAGDASASARGEMELSYFGLMRLAQEFGTQLRARKQPIGAPALAWVNILSIYALTSSPAHGAYSAAKAAAYAFAQCQRAELQAVGIRVVNVFPGAIEESDSDPTALPKLSPNVLAAAIVTGLQEGVEDVYPGAFAQEWYARWRDNPKVLERELAAANTRQGVP